MVGEHRDVRNCRQSCGSGGTAKRDQTKKLHMRLDTPAHLDTSWNQRVGQAHTLDGAKALWDIFERATGVKGEFKNLNWVLD